MALNPVVSWSAGRPSVATLEKGLLVLSAAGHILLLRESDSPFTVVDGTSRPIACFGVAGDGRIAAVRCSTDTHRRASRRKAADSLVEIFSLNLDTLEVKSGASSPTTMSSQVVWSPCCKYLCCANNISQRVTVFAVDATKLKFVSEDHRCCPCFVNGFLVLLDYKTRVFELWDLDKNKLVNTLRAVPKYSVIVDAVALGNHLFMLFNDGSASLCEVVADASFGKWHFFKNFAVVKDDFFYVIVQSHAQEYLVAVDNQVCRVTVDPPKFEVAVPLNMRVAAFRNDQCAVGIDKHGTVPSCAIEWPEHSMTACNSVSSGVNGASLETISAPTPLEEPVQPPVAACHNDPPTNRNEEWMHVALVAVLVLVVASLWRRLKK